MLASRSLTFVKESTERTGKTNPSIARLGCKGGSGERRGMNIIGLAGDL